MTGYSVTRNGNEITIWSDNKELLESIESYVELCVDAIRYRNGIEKRNKPIIVEAEDD